MLTRRNQIGPKALALAAALMVSVPAAAERLIPFQGRVTDAAGAPLNGVYEVNFAIYDAPTGGPARWVERHTGVSIMAGEINVFLGSFTSLDDPDGNENPSDAVSFAVAAGPRFLGIKVGDQANQEMVPRHELLPAFHARGADIAESVRDGVITHASLNPAVVRDLVPSNTIIFYNGSVCPVDWVEVTAARGRTLVGLPAGGTVGGGNSVSSLSNNESRTHNHSLLNGKITGFSTGDSHNHRWIDFTLSTTTFATFNVNGTRIGLIDWTTGRGVSSTAGATNWPPVAVSGHGANPTWYTDNDSHSHDDGSYTVSNPNTNSALGIPTRQYLVCQKL